MTILDILHTKPAQTPVVIEPTIEEPVAAPIVESEVAKEEVKVEGTPAPAPEEIAATTVVEPLADDVNKQPTVTHAEAGTAHTEGEVATTVDGTPAAEPVVEAAPVTEETPKEDKKAAIKEKVEKTKSEGKGFFAKFFGSKEKSPKAKKVKTPKTEKSDPIVAAAPAEEVAATEPVAPVEVAPVVAEAPVEAEAAPVVEAPVVEATEAAPVEAVAAPEVPVKEEIKSPKPNRRLSARFTGFIKNVTKKEHKEETKEVAPAATTEETPAVAEEAPKIAEPTPSEPLKIEEPEVKAAPAVAATPIVSATA